MTKIQLKIDDQQLMALFNTAPERVLSALDMLVTSGSLSLQEKAIEGAPTGATGLLRNSIQAKPTRNVGGIVSGGAITAHAYAAAVENGTRPHFPPVEALKPWVKAKFGLSIEAEIAHVAFMIARKIAKRGTKAQPFMRNATTAVRPEFAAQFQVTMAKLIAAFNREQS